jgi:hypothetical protein
MICLGQECLESCAQIGDGFIVCASIPNGTAAGTQLSGRTPYAILVSRNAVLHMDDRAHVHHLRTHRTRNDELRPCSPLGAPADPA